MFSNKFSFVSHLGLIYRGILGHCFRLRNIPKCLRRKTEEADEIHGNYEISSPIAVDASYSTLIDIQPAELCYEINSKTHIKRHFHKNDMLVTHSKISSKRSWQTNNKRYLNRHLNTHSGVKKFQCDIYKNTFKHKGNLTGNIKNGQSNTSEKKYKCLECSFQTKYKRSLKHHLNTHNDIKHLQCDICEKRLTGKGSLTRHIKNKHLSTIQKEYKCPDCSYQTNVKSNFERHLNAHKGIKHFQCDFCETKCSEKSNLRAHIIIHHSNTNEEEYKCTKCPFQTKHKTSLKRHLNTHNDIKHFQCEICEKTFSQKSSLMRHIKNKHFSTKEKDYQCSECPYQTNYKGNLKTHYNTHKDIKPFQCDICEMKFSQKEIMKQHLKNKHQDTSEKDYKCPYCSHQTNSKSNLKTHLNTHSGIKPFQCDFCEKKFAGKHNMKEHINNHHSNTSVNKYKCPDCPYQTNDKRSLKYHLYTHSDVKPFNAIFIKEN